MDKEFLLLKLRSAIADKEWTIACANNEIRQRVFSGVDEVEINMNETGYKKYKFEYPWFDENDKPCTEIIFVLADSLEDAKRVLHHACLRPLDFVFMGTED